MLRSEGRIPGIQRVGASWGVPVDAEKLADAQGGKLFVGVNDDGILAGLQNARKLMEDLPNKIRDTMGVIVNINLHQQADKD